mmetsp:Transcript_27377/g.66475  ORF Transcript_27377/g.66475 Transcript_27377/m.66475 type:complete len:705 (+) Transcript_27377:103-2217(+)
MNIENILSETDDWLNEHRDKRKTFSHQTTVDTAAASEDVFSESITSINMAGEVQKMSALDDSEFSNTVTSDATETAETEEKEAIAMAESEPEVSSGDNDNENASSAAAEEKEQSSSQSKDQVDMQNQEQDETHDKSEEVTKEEEEKPASSPSKPASSKQEEAMPRVETVTSLDSLDLFPAKTDSNAEVIDATTMSETAVVPSEDQPVAEAVAVDQPTEAKQEEDGEGEEGNDQESKPSLAARAAAAAATAATGIMPVLSNLSASPRSSPRASPAGSPRASPSASPTRSTQEEDDKPSLAARAAAAAAAASAGIMPVLSNLSGSTPRNSPRTSPARTPTRTSPISTARTWPDENNANTVEDDTFLDNGEPIPGSLPSPPRSEVGTGYTAMPSVATTAGPVDLDDYKQSPATSPVATAENTTTDIEAGGGEAGEAGTSPVAAVENPNTTDIEAGEAGSESSKSKKEAQVLSVVPTMVEDNYEPKEKDLDDMEINREVPPQDSAHEFKEADTNGTRNRAAAIKAGLKTKKGKGILLAILLVLIGIGVGIGFAVSPGEPSYCNAVRNGYQIPNENTYQQLDLHWIVDVATTDQFNTTALMSDIKEEFQSSLVPMMAGCKGSFVKEKDARIANGYVVRTREIGDCSAAFPRPCFGILIDFAVWVKGDFVNKLEMIDYLVGTFGTELEEQIESQNMVRTAALVILQEVKR